MLCESKQIGLARLSREFIPNSEEYHKSHPSHFEPWCDLGSFPVLVFRLLKTHFYHFTYSTSTEKQLLTTSKLGTYGIMY